MEVDSSECLFLFVEYTRENLLFCFPIHSYVMNSLEIKCCIFICNPFDILEVKCLKKLLQHTLDYSLLYISHVVATKRNFIVVRNLEIFLFYFYNDLMLTKLKFFLSLSDEKKMLKHASFQYSKKKIYNKKSTKNSTKFKITVFGKESEVVLIDQ